MDFGQAIKSAFAHYVDGSGRASRSEFWYWVLFTFLVGFGLGLVREVARATGGHGGELAIRGLNVLVDLAFFLPGIAITIRRLHDTNHSGWWYLISFTIIGLIPLLIWFCTPGGEGSNRFGPDPLKAQDPGQTATVFD